MHRPFPFLGLLVGCAMAGSAQQTPDPIPTPIANPPARSGVSWHRAADGDWWARGSTYKAGFAVDGFTYVPFFGATAPRNFPVRFTLRNASVGGKPLVLTATATSVRRDGDRIVIDRGPVHEVYELSAAAVEQTFVVDGALAGDVDLEIEVRSDLPRLEGRPGVQFGNDLGSVEYGDAFLVTGPQQTRIATQCAGGSLRLHVPAGIRAPGPVVIDPIVTTRTLTPTAVASLAPDLAYDVTTNRWLVAWAEPFSASDHDVVAEKRTGGGEAIAGSFMVLDISPVSYSLPRVANLNRFDRFLVVMERIDNRPGGTRYQVWGRTVDAAGLAPPGPEFAISPAFPNSNQWHPDVGGDPGTGTRWFVVWTKDGDTFARLVDAAGVPAPTVIPIETGILVSEVPQVSSSNGNGQTPVPIWCVVYMLQPGPGNRDIWGATFDLAGNVAGAGPIAGGSEDDQSPYVSAPLVDGRTSPAFAICYERHGTVQEMHLQVLAASLVNLVPEVDVSRRYGLSGLSCRVDSDGLRLAVSCQAGAALALATLAVVDGAIVLHESPQTTMVGDSPCLASKRSGGGGATDYGFVCRRSDLQPSLIGFGLYRGHAAGGFARRLTGCGLGLATSGVPALGQTPRFSLSGSGTDVPFLFVGVPAPAVSWCGTCLLGIQQGSALTSALGPTLDIRIPADVRLVGVRLAVQGMTFGSGPCSPGALRFSDTVDVAVQ